MKGASISTWIQASRPPAIVNLIFPLLLGQALAFEKTGRWNWTIFAALGIYAWFDQLYIVFWNDYADARADRHNHEFNIFSGGSRVLPEGRLDPRDLLRAGWIALGLVMAVGIYLTLSFQIVFALPLMAAGLILLWAYSMPPLRLNYRGGGELLQATGCALLLPLLGYDAQAGTLTDFPGEALIPFFIYHLISAVATAIPDHAADRRAGKRTLAVRIGIRPAARWNIVLGLLGAAVGFTLLQPAGPWSRALTVWFPPAALGAAAFLSRRLETSPRAVFFYDVLIVAIPIAYAAGFCMSAI